MKYFRDGSLIGAFSTAKTAIDDRSGPLVLGGVDAMGNYWVGALDELRISSVARSADWLWATWRSVAANTAFNEYGPVLPSVDGSVLVVR
jgi:hypothetical protein